jgi:ferric-dicitrate binding protein FerR (iron transport regulator)
MELPPDPDWILLARLFSGEATPDERAAIGAWRRASKANARTFDAARSAWLTADAAEPSVDAAWQRLRKRITAPPRARHPRASTRPARPSRPRPSRRWHRLPESVALVVVLVTAVLWAVRAPAPAAPPVESRVFTTAPGQQSIVTLTDGSTVHLNADSRLSVAAAFGQSSRVVELVGEAFFDVVPDPQRPFVVASDQARVRVTGTAFGVHAYPEQRRAVVAVAEGSVVLWPAQARADSVVLAAGDVAQADARSLGRVRRGVPTDPLLSWRSGQLVFDDAPLDAVLRGLARRYALNVSSPLAPERADRLNATFGREPVSDVLDAVAAALGLRYVRQGDAVVFTR